MGASRLRLGACGSEGRFGMCGFPRGSRSSQRFLVSSNSHNGVVSDSFDRPAKIAFTDACTDAEGSHLRPSQLFLIRRGACVAVGKWIAQRANQSMLDCNSDARAIPGNSWDPSSQPKPEHIVIQFKSQGS